MRSAGLDTIHTLDLPEANRTKDSVINEFSLEERRVLVTKDADFVQSFMLQGRPYKLLLVSTGNISNHELLGLFHRHLRPIAELFERCWFLELTREFVVIHR